LCGGICGYVAKFAWSSWLVPSEIFSLKVRSAAEMEKGRGNFTHVQMQAIVSRLISLHVDLTSLNSYQKVMTHLRYNA